jgi:hypothetical protein
VTLLKTYTLQIIFGMLGVPEKDMELLIGMNAVRTSGSTTSAQAANASKELTDYLEQLVVFFPRDIERRQSHK